MGYRAVLMSINGNLISIPPDKNYSIFILFQLRIVIICVDFAIHVDLQLCFWLFCKLSVTDSNF